MSILRKSATRAAKKVLDNEGDIAHAVLADVLHPYEQLLQQNLRWITVEVWVTTKIEGKERDIPSICIYLANTCLRSEKENLSAQGRGDTHCVTRGREGRRVALCFESQQSSPLSNASIQPASPE